MKKLFVLLSAIFLVSSLSALTYSVKVPSGTNACYIAGDMNNWKHQIMNKIDATHYTIDFPNATPDQTYKYCSGPGWGYVEKDSKGEEIANRTYSPSDVVETWVVVYNESKSKVSLDFNVTVPQGTKCCYIRGGWDGWAEYKEMKKVDDTHYTIKLKVDKQLKYNYAAGPGNGYAEIKNDNWYAVERSYSENDVVYKFAACYDKSVPDAIIIYTVTVPEGTPRCYIAGGWNGWTNLTEMKKTDPTHFTASFLSNKALKYMYFSGPDIKYRESNSDKKFEFPRMYNPQDIVVNWNEVWYPEEL